MSSDLAALGPLLAQALARPRGEQLDALATLRATLGRPAMPEAWNSRFGTGSLFDAWTRSSLVRSLHAANAAVIRQTLATAQTTAQATGRGRVHLLEIGGGDGRLWERALRAAAPDAPAPDLAGLELTLTVIDPVAEVEAEVRARLPDSVTLDFRQARIEDLLAEDPVRAGLPAVDLVICSLTLHHVAGRDAAERAAAGLDGPGKAEVLEALATAVAPRNGRILINEADVHCEVDLPPGDPILAERMLDSYVRRCALALLDDVATRPDADPDLRARWQAVTLHWCIEQLDLAAVPLADRDVYELDAPRWRALFRHSGLGLLREVPTDRYGLFRQYLLQPV